MTKKQQQYTRRTINRYKRQLLALFLDDDYLPRNVPVYFGDIDHPNFYVCVSIGSESRRSRRLLRQAVQELVDERYIRPSSQSAYYELYIEPRPVGGAESRGSR
jgi:hypothetical protein